MAATRVQSRLLQLPLSFRTSFHRSKAYRWTSNRNLQERRPLATAATTTQYDEDYDVVVVGSGAGGLTTAITAAISGGQKVLVAEKTGLYGGTSAYSGGALWVPTNPLATKQGYFDDREQVEKYLRHFLKDDYDEDLISAYLQSGPEMVQWMEDKAATRFAPFPMPDYYMEVEGASKAGRTLVTTPFDGRKLGSLVKQVRYPLQGYCAFGSLQLDPGDLERWKGPFKTLQNFSFVARSLLRYAVDQVRYGKGTWLCNGNALVGRLLYSAANVGVELRNHTAVTAPILENGRVTGVELLTSGRNIRVRVRKGVVLASGGFSRSAELSRKYLPNQDYTVSPRGNQGDGMQFGLASGGTCPPSLPDNALWTPVSEYRDRKGHTRAYPHFALGLSKPGSIVVDGDGKRFANEAQAYQDFGKATHAAGVRNEYLIADHRYLQKYGMGFVLPAPYPTSRALRSNYLVSAPTISALAAKLGIDPENLRTTVDRFNAFALDGKDLDFNRGEGSYDQANGDPDMKPNSSLGPLEQAPFYAVRMYPGNGGSLYGLQTNKDGQVLKEDGEPVAGLYAVGSDANSFMKGTYPSGGLTLGPAMVFGYRAGLHISG